MSLILNTNDLLTLRKNRLGLSLIPSLGSYYEYENVNNDSYLRRSMIKYFRDMLQNKLRDGDLSVVNCLEVKGNKVSKKKCDSKNHSDKDLKIIANYLYDNIVYPKKLVKKVLIKYTKLSGTNWYDLKINQDIVFKLLNHAIKKEL